MRLIVYSLLYWRNLLAYPSLGPADECSLFCYCLSLISVDRCCYWNLKNSIKTQGCNGIVPHFVAIICSDGSFWCFFFRNFTATNTARHTWRKAKTSRNCVKQLNYRSASTHPHTPTHTQTLTHSQTNVCN